MPEIDNTTIPEAEVLFNSAEVLLTRAKAVLFKEVEVFLTKEGTFFKGRIIVSRVDILLMEERCYSKWLR